MQTLKQLTARTTVRQNHRDIVQGNAAIFKEFVDNMVQERGHWLLAVGYWLLAIGYWLLAINYNNNYDFKLNCGF